jgi:hypothetical protein
MLRQQPTLFGQHGFRVVLPSIKGDDRRPRLVPFAQCILRNEAMGESDFENLSVRLLAQLLEQFGVNLDTGLRRFVCTLWHCGSHFLDSKQ